MNLVHIVKDNWPIALGGAVGLFVISRFMKSGNSGGSDLSGYYSAQVQAAAVNGQTNAQLQIAQLQSDAQNRSLNMQYALEVAKIDGANNANNLNAINAYNESVGNMAIKGASAAAEMISAYMSLPAAAINASSAENQAALTASAKVAATGVAATPANLSGAADLLQAAYKPLDYVGKIVSGFGNNIADLSSNTINSIASMSTDISNNTGRVMSELGQSAARANAAGSQATSSIVGSLALAAVAL